MRAGSAQLSAAVSFQLCHVNVPLLLTVTLLQNLLLDLKFCSFTPSSPGQSHPPSLLFACLNFCVQVRLRQTTCVKTVMLKSLAGPLSHGDIQ